MIRNPFDYYISVWAYRSQNDMKYAHAYFHPSVGWTRHNTDLDDVLNKAGLLNEETSLLCSDVQHGCCGDQDIIRFRRWMRLVNFGVVNWLTHRVLHHHWGYIAYNERTPANSIHPDFAVHMEQLDNSSAHCWVHTDSIVEDIRKCVALYQEYEPTARDTKLGTIEGVKHNPSIHCRAQTYYDAGTVKKVKEGDAQIFEYFKYQVPGA
jgi:hypothetical protein